MEHEHPGQHPPSLPVLVSGVAVEEEEVLVGLADVESDPGDDPGDDPCEDPCDDPCDDPDNSDNGGLSGL